MFCSYCGNQYIYHFENNRPVADFFFMHYNKNNEKN